MPSAKALSSRGTVKNTQRYGGRLAAAPHSRSHPPLPRPLHLSSLADPAGFIPGARNFKNLLESLGRCRLLAPDQDRFGAILADGRRVNFQAPAFWKGREHAHAAAINTVAVAQPMSRM